jgi:LysR family transcriptional regulator, hydrogen peroxide-inducible genes activator
MGTTFRQLTYFMALAETRSFGLAAAVVHVTQPALSMQIKEMEATLGVALFERRPRDVRLTRAGREVLAHASRVLSEMRELEAAARRHGLGGRLNLGVIPTVAPYLLPVALTRLRAADLTRDIRVREAQTEVLLKGLDEGTLDAVVIASPAAGRGTVAEVLFQDRFLLAGSGTRLAALGAGREALRPRAIDPDELLLLDEGHCLADQALEVCALDRRQTRVDLGASSLSTLCGLVAEGFGLTFLPELAVRTETAAAAEMRLVRFAAPEPAREVRLVRRESASDAGWFADLARILAEAGADLLAHARRLV